MSIQIAELIDDILFEFGEVDGRVSQLIRVEDLPWLHRYISMMLRTCMLLVYHCRPLLLLRIGAVLGACLWLRWIDWNSIGLHLWLTSTGHRLLRLMEEIEPVALCEFVPQLLLQVLLDLTLSHQW